MILPLNRWIVRWNNLKHVFVAHLLFNPRPQVRQLLLTSGILRLRRCNWLLVKLCCLSWGWTDNFSCGMRALVRFYNFVDLLLLASLVPDFLALLHGFQLLEVFHLTFKFLVKCRQIFKSVNLLSAGPFKAFNAFSLTLCLLIVHNNLLSFFVWLLVRVLQQTVVIFNLSVLQSAHEVIEGNLNFFFNLLRSGPFARASWLWPRLLLFGHTHIFICSFC